MKARASIILLIVSVSLAALVLVQWRQLRDQKQLTEELQIQVEAMQGEIQSAKARSENMEAARAALQERVRALQLQEASPRQDLSAPAALPIATSAAAEVQPRQQRSANPLAMVSDMMKDPEMRKAFEQQQMMAVNMMYGPLFEKLGLTEEQTDEFKKLLLDQQMDAIEQGTAMLDQENADPAAAAEKLAAQKAERDEKMKELLGEEGFQQVEDFTLTMGERMMMNQQLKLPPQQTEQLLSIIAEEKRALQATQMPGSDPAQNPAAILQDGFMEKHLADQQTINTIVYERARAMLTPEQLQDLAEFQESQLIFTKGQIQMTQKMMQQQQPDAGLAPAPLETTPPPAP